MYKRQVEDLAGHELLGFTQPESLNVWPLRHAGGSTYLATPTLATSSGETQPVSYTHLNEAVPCCTWCA